LRTSDGCQLIAPETVARKECNPSRPAKAAVEGWLGAVERFAEEEHRDFESDSGFTADEFRNESAKLQPAARA
jgi:hypothetical protein